MSYGDSKTWNSNGTNKPFQYGMLRDKLCIGNEILDLEDTEVSGLLDIPIGVTYALLSVEAEGSDYIRYWSSGNLPTVDEGHKFGDGGVFDVFNSINIHQVRIYSSGSTSIMVSYFK